MATRSGRRGNRRRFRPAKLHGLVLLVAGIVYICHGLTYIFSEPSRNRNEALRVAFDWLPIEAWGSIFILVGLVAMVASRGSPWFRWGYAALAGLSAGWAATYAAGMIIENSPTSNLSGMFAWGLQAFLWLTIPGLVDPDKTVVVVIKD